MACLEFTGGEPRIRSQYRQPLANAGQLVVEKRGAITSSHNRRRSPLRSTMTYANTGSAPTPIN
jgi:hypothetical protein